MKKFIIFLLVTVVLLSGIFITGYYYKDEIYKYYQFEVLKVRDNIKITNNEYYKNRNYKYVQNTDDFLAKDNNHLKNIFYTIINSGNKTFTFYCSDEYTSCKQDITNLIENDEVLSNINNFVHPYNSFEKINASYDEFGKVVVKVDKVYNDDEIASINATVDKIINENIKSNMTTKQKIKKIHDYIINHGKYATDNYRKNNPNTSYNKASDILQNGYGLCSAYADAMAIFLERFGIENYKIASDTHIWNLVKVNGKWLHLDLTWDDPVTSNGKDKLQELFMLITNKELKKLSAGTLFVI